MAGTKIYGASDDLIEFEGDIYGEIGCYGSSQNDPIKVKVSDGTEFDIFYSDSGLWKINVTKKGSNFDLVTEAIDPDSDNYSDELFLTPGDLTAKYKTKESTWKRLK